MREELKAVLTIKRDTLLVVTSIAALALLFTSHFVPGSWRHTMTYTMLGVIICGSGIWYLVPSRIVLPKWFPTVYSK